MAFDVVRAKDFVSQLEKSIGLLSALSKFQKVFERNASPISDVFKVFLELPATFNEIKMPISAFGIISSVLKESLRLRRGGSTGTARTTGPGKTGSLHMEARGIHPASVDVGVDAHTTKCVATTPTRNSFTHVTPGYGAPVGVRLDWGRLAR
ncbi:hypothetical protein PF006_g210 [Phytophthora fragariae]|uniref:Uncharacterized protein n=1 Tax=Phytophthora fragariae TaxID=53985 RepID=A0A6A3UV10_9STRA|nr:hypothetical protein PF006_g210 [Phytophthora fragariae]